MIVKSSNTIVTLSTVALTLTALMSLSRRVDAAEDPIRAVVSKAEASHSDVMARRLPHPVPVAFGGGGGGGGHNGGGGGSDPSSGGGHGGGHSGGNGNGGGGGGGGGGHSNGGSGGGNPFGSGGGGGGHSNGGGGGNPFGSGGGGGRSNSGGGNPFGSSGSGAGGGHSNGGGGSSGGGGSNPFGSSSGSKGNRNQDGGSNPGNSGGLGKNSGGGRNDGPSGGSSGNSGGSRSNDSASGNRSPFGGSTDGGNRSKSDSGKFGGSSGDRSDPNPNSGNRNSGDDVLGKRIDPGSFSHSGEGRKSSGGSGSSGSSGLSSSRFGKFGDTSKEDGLGKPITVHSFGDKVGKGEGRTDGSKAGGLGNRSDREAGKNSDRTDTRVDSDRSGRDGTKGKSSLEDTYRNSFGERGRKNANSDASKVSTNDKLKFGGPGANKKGSFKSNKTFGAKFSKSSASFSFKSNFHHDTFIWKFNCHSHFGWHYYPSHFSWYCDWFGFHPCYSSWWWCEWWPSYYVYPHYVTYVPTYYPVYDNGGSVVNYYNYYDTPSGDAGPPPTDASGGATTGSNGAPTVTGEIPKDEVDSDFAAELEQLSKNDGAMNQLKAGSEAFKNRDYLGASDAFRKAMLAERNNSVAKFAMAHAQFALGEYGYAAFLIRRAMELRPNWPSIGSDLRDLYSEQADLEEQTLALDSFLKSHPDDLDAWMLSGYVAFFSGDLEKADDAFSGVLAKDANDSVASAFEKRIDEIKKLLEKDGEENKSIRSEKDGAPGQADETGGKSETPKQPTQDGAPPAPAPGPTGGNGGEAPPAGSNGGG